MRGIVAFALAIVPVRGALHAQEERPAVIGPVRETEASESPSSPEPNDVDVRDAETRERVASADAVTANDVAGESDVRVRVEFGEGVTVEAGEAFSLQVRARIQFRVAANAEALAPPDDGYSTEYSLLIRRARIVLAGRAFVPELEYYVQLGVAPRDMEADLLVPLRDAYLTWQPHRDVGVRFGQMKVPFGAQRVTSSSALQFVDRSAVITELNLDRDIGIYLMSDDLFGLDGLLQYRLGVFGGRGRNRFGGQPDAVMFAGRVAIEPLAPLDDRVEADPSRSKDARLSIGVSAAYNLASTRFRSTNGAFLPDARMDYLHLGADVQLKWAGLSVVTEALYRDGDERAAEDGTPSGLRELAHAYTTSMWGWFAQAGYVLPWLPLEVSARYGAIYPLEAGGDVPDVHLREVGVALSYYFEEHDLKLQADYFHYEQHDPRLASDRHEVRVQTQLYF